jgi:Tfp pilus assembly protein PilO
MHLERDQINAIVTVAFLSAAFVFGLWLPHQVREKQLNERIEAAQKEMGFNRDNARTMTNLAREVIELKKIVSTMDKHVPESSELAQLLRSLSTELANSTVAGQEILAHPIVHGRDYNVIPLTLLFRGSFRDVFSFLKKSESMRRLIRINRVEIQGDSDQSENDLDVRVELSTFFVPVQQPSEGTAK